VSTRPRTLLFALGGIAFLSVVAPAAIIGTALGSGAPPATLGGYAMTPFPLDTRTLFPDVTSVPSPLGGNVVFSQPMSHRRIGIGWATWSHGYTGDVYYSNGSTSVGLTLPADTTAFILYAQPNPFARHLITATAQDGTSVTQNPDGASGASAYGFHVEGAGTITNIHVAVAGAAFAIGEFSIAVPEPTSLALLVLGCTALRRWR
jgi:hypothetical protein